MENQNKEMDKEFKNMMFNALSRNNPGVHMDEDGFIVVPTMIRRRRKSSDNSGNSCQQKKSQDDKTD